jgi:hypothetical protein
MAGIIKAYAGLRHKADVEPTYVIRYVTVYTVTRRSPGV